MRLLYDAPHGEAVVSLMRLFKQSHKRSSRKPRGPEKRPGYVWDAETPVPPEEMRPGCHWDYYPGIPADGYCSDTVAEPSAIPER